LRPGTLPVPLIVGLGEAAALADAEHDLRQRIAAKIKETLLLDLADVDFVVNGDLSKSQPHVLNASFPGVDSEALMMATRDMVAISNGSACTSASYTPSHVLRAMGLDDERIESAVRISWGPGVAAVPSGAIVDAVKSLRA
jgi:cysteine desulfurase